MVGVDKVCFQCRIVPNGSDSWARLRGVNMDKFNFQDFQRNPKKYELFKTATVRNTMIHQDGETLEGTIVGIRFAGVKRNQLYRRDEPVYVLSTGDVCYANNLHSFTL